jgi:hypothetical protein
MLILDNPYYIYCTFRMQTVSNFDTATYSLGTNSDTLFAVCCLTVLYFASIVYYQKQLNK